jgi:oligopeptide/dipeptide ABC transporter ATP-binding protein
VTQPLLEVRGLSTWYPVHRGVLARAVAHVQAVTDVSLTVQRGETVALVGESGCGKSTLGRTLLGLERARSGRALFMGHDLLDRRQQRTKSLRREMQMVFQDPAASLNPRMTVRDLLTEGPIEHGLMNEAPDALATRLLNDVGMESSALHRYPLEFSGGQRQRIGIARALSVKPSLLVCDEALSALDVSVQAQVINLLMDLKDRYGLSYLFISHDLRVVRQIADRIAVMYLGRIVEEGETETVMAAPCHPYTKALLSAVPRPGGEKRRRIILAGEVPSALKPPPGCPFHTRCPEALPVCRQHLPLPRTVDHRHVCCHLYNRGDHGTYVEHGTI